MRTRLFPVLLWLFPLGAAGLLLTAGQGLTDQEGPGQVRVVPIEKGKFLVDGVEQPLTIRAGDWVVWVNKDAMAHTATSADGGKTFDTGIIPPGGQSQPVQFTRAGVIDYLCTPHPTMRSTIVVR